MASRSRQTVLKDIEETQSRLSKLYEELETVPDETANSNLPMKLPEYQRYGRQMILDGIGLQGQLNLRNSKVLVVGAGGLGSPALLYLAGAGVGNITIMDHDTVDLSNLHRQVIHNNARIGVNKAESAAQAVKELNSEISVNVVKEPFTISTLRQLDPPIGSFDLVLDCTDNATTRYLLNDACVYYGITLVSGAAIRTEGWNVVWNLPPREKENNVEENNLQRGPCYRCMFPEPKSNGRQRADRCEDEGVLGVIPGVIGVLMACDALKLLLGLHDLKPSLNLFSPTIPGMAPFRNIKIRPRNEKCIGCGTESRSRWTKILESGPDNLDFMSCAIDPAANDIKRLSVKDLRQKMDNPSDKTVLIDVRTETETKICNIPGFINVPLRKLMSDPSNLVKQYPECQEFIMLCRRGNDSLEAAVLLEKHLTSQKISSIQVSDISGGLRKWSEEIDNLFPVY